MRLLLAMCVLVAGCASGFGSVYPPPPEQSIACNSRAACDTAWQRAQAWLATRAAYRLAVATPAVLQTFGPETYSQRPAFTVTREQGADGSGTIRVRAVCSAQFGPGGRGCLYDASPDAGALVAAIGS